MTTQKLISADQMKELFGEMWQTLQIIVAANNMFLEQMQASETLSPADEEKLRQWSAAVAKAHQRVTDAAERMNARQPGQAVN